jgi:hypothetical protein
MRHISSVAIPGDQPKNTVKTRLECSKYPLYVRSAIVRLIFRARLDVVLLFLLREFYSELAEKSFVILALKWSKPVGCGI